MELVNGLILKEGEGWVEGVDFIHFFKMLYHVTNLFQLSWSVSKSVGNGIHVKLE